MTSHFNVQGKDPFEVCPTCGGPLLYPDKFCSERCQYAYWGMIHEYLDAAKRNPYPGEPGGGPGRWWKVAERISRDHHGRAMDAPDDPPAGGSSR
jgi:hypothetical protein